MCAAGGNICLKRTMQNNCVVMLLRLWCALIIAGRIIVQAKENDEDDFTYSYRAYYEIDEILKEHKIIPDVIDKAPEHKIEVGYNADDYSGAFLDFGTYFTADQIKKRPNWIRWPSLPSLLYTLIMISPDYPTREDPSEKEWQYWVVTNIHGGDLEMAETLTEYSPPTEIVGRAPHRFVFLAFLQRSMDVVKFEEPRFKKELICKERANFNTRRFAEKYNFRDLIAVNFFLMKPTNYTKKKGKKIGR